MILMHRKPISNHPNKLTLSHVLPHKQPPALYNRLWKRNNNITSYPALLFCLKSASSLLRLLTYAYIGTHPKVFVFACNQLP